MLRSAVLLVVCLSAVVHSTQVSFRDCGGKTAKGKIASVDIAPCTDPKQCELKRGTRPVVTINFTPNEVVSAVTAKVTGILPGGIKAPFPLDNPDGCQNSGLQCPLPTNTSVSYNTAIEIKTEYPPWKVVVKWELLDQNNADITCFMVSTKITEE